MEYNKETRAFLAWAAPTGVLITPPFLAFFGYVTWRDLKAGAHVDLLDPGFIFVLAACVVGFLVALNYCKKELGWFSGKKKGKPEL